MIKERWAPLSNRMWPSTVVFPVETLAMAVFNKHILVEVAESEFAAVAVGVYSLWVTVLIV